MRSILGAALIGLCASSLAGCKRDVTLEFELRTLPTEARDISIDVEQIRLEEGFTVAVVARPLDNRKRMDWETQVELFPSLNGVFDIARLDWDEELEERKDDDVREGDWGFLFWGEAPGAANVEVFIDGEFETDIPVLVSPQPD